MNLMKCIKCGEERISPSGDDNNPFICRACGHQFNIPGITLKGPEVEKETDPAITVSVNEPTAPKRRGRQKGPRPVLTVPIGEFSTKELAEQNKVEYPIAVVFINEAIDAKTIQFSRSERRNPKGQLTNLYIAIAVQPA